MSIALADKLAQDPAKTAGAALRTFFNIAAAWKLDTEQAMTLLGFEPSTRSTFFKWKRAPESARLTREKLERLSYIFGIYKDLQILLPREEAADSWIRRPNAAPLFAGQSALDRMLSGNVADLYVVRQYLDAQRGWS
ncbi:MAG: MbcA/ParS/Xre antitoxin family protein [Thiohalobacteraceae bacterium]